MVIGALPARPTADPNGPPTCRPNVNSLPKTDCIVGDSPLYSQCQFLVGL